ncbi:MAG: sensor histidine kinase [Blastocatellia bacterium]
MATLRIFLRQHALWVGLIVVIVPLLIILCLQYRSLVMQERTAPAYRKELLRNRLQAINQEIEAFYRAQAEQALNVPSETIPTREDGCVVVSNLREELPRILDPIAEYFSRRQFRGARRYFFGVRVGLRVGTESNETREVTALLLYDPVSKKMRFEGGSPDWTIALAGFATCRLAPDQELCYYNHKFAPDHPALMKSAFNAQGRVIGGAGMLLDEQFFANELAPDMVRRALPGTQGLPSEETRNVIVSVHDHLRQARWSTELLKEAGDDVEVRAPFTFAFSAWMLEARLHRQGEGEEARRMFLLNLSLPALLGLLILCGLALSLRMAARTMRLSQLKSDFVSNVSHELRTPLTSIRTLGEFLRLGRVSDPEKLRKYGEYIENESRRLTQLIDNILDFSRIESGRKVYRFEPADLAGIVAGTLDSFDVRLKQAGFNVRLEPAPAPLPKVRVDAEAIAQAFINLLDNAVKYSAGAREIIVRLGGQGDEATISVTDYGIGIARADQPKIFEKFYRVGGTLVHNVKGSGLGLAIVNHIVEAHGGRVTVESELGKGSTFTIHLRYGAIEP